MIDLENRKDAIKYDNIAIFPFFQNAPEDKEHTLDSLVNFYMGQLLLQLESHGFDIYNDKFDSDFYAIIALTKASLMVTEGYNHYLSPILDQVSNMVYNRETGANDDEKKK